MRQGNTQERFNPLDEFLVEDLLSVSDDDLLDEVEEDLGNRTVLAAKFDSIVQDANPANENLVTPTHKVRTWEPFRKSAQFLRRGISLSADAFVANRAHAFPSLAFALLLLMAVFVAKSEREIADALQQIAPAGQTTPPPLRPLMPAPNLSAPKETMDGSSGPHEKPIFIVIPGSKILGGVIAIAVIQIV